MNIFFGMIQHGIKGDFYLLLQNYFNHIYPFRLFVVFTYGMIGYFTYKILLSTHIFNIYESKLIAFISIIVPISSSLVSLAIVPFLFPVLLFYIAFFLLSKYYNKLTIFMRLGILLLFYLSFSTNSLLVFYASVLLYLYYMDTKEDLLKFESIKLFFIKKIDFIILPVVYFIYKIFFLQPYGIYENYNHINIKVLSYIPIMIFKTFKVMFIDFTMYLFNDLTIVIIAVVVSLIISVLININLDFFKDNKKYLFILAILLFVFAVFPYLAVLKYPVYKGWESRFSLLVGISLSLFYIFFISVVSQIFLNYKNKVFIFFISLFISLFVMKNILIQYQQNIDWFYQVSLQKKLKNSNIIEKNNTILLNIKDNDKLLFNRKFRFYELNGLYKQVSKKDDKLFITNIKQIKGYKNLRKYKQYNFFKWNSTSPVKIVKFNVTFNKVRNIDKIKILYESLFDQQSFQSNLKKFTTVKFVGFINLKI
jgi:hypothetical protein